MIRSVPVKVAAYQAPLLRAGSIEAALGLIRERVDWCDSEGVEILCCPEGVLGGLADYATRPADLAIDVAGGRLDALLAPLASDTVTTILGFTEIDRQRRLFNSAVVFHQGAVVAVYRKLHPAINRSVYDAGTACPVFTIGRLTFGIIICRDSNDVEPAQIMASQGATALFVPTNNGLPHIRAHAEIAAEARQADVARATENGVSVIRADVAGRTEDLMSCGSSEIVDRHGIVLQSAQPYGTSVIVASIDAGSSSQKSVIVKRSERRSVNRT